MKIVYIDIDSLNTAALGCYGYHRDTTPALDRLAAAGVRYENCCRNNRTGPWYSSGSWMTGAAGTLKAAIRSRSWDREMCASASADGKK